jgi:predicted DNA-binding ribbon-helix-helix protein
MCEFFVKADPILYESRSRSVRIHGVLTSLRLENMMWDTLAQMATEDGRTTNSLLVQFHDEVMAHRGEVNNFASFLRVTCLRYLQRKSEAGQLLLPKIAGEPRTSAPLTPSPKNSHLKIAVRT